MSDTSQYAMIGSAVCTAASDAQETSGVRGFREYSGSGGRSYEVMLLAIAAVVYGNELCSVSCGGAVAGGEVCDCYCRAKTMMMMLLLRAVGCRGTGRLGERASQAGVEACWRCNWFLWGSKGEAEVGRAATEASRVRVVLALLKTGTVHHDSVFRPTPGQP